MLRKKLLTLLLSASCTAFPLLTEPACATDSTNLIQLDGSASQDADGDRLLYSWRQVSGPKVQLLDASTAKPSFYAEVAGDYAFELIVSDGRIQSEPAIVNVIIEEANEIPVASLPSKLKIELGQNVILDGTSSSDADNDVLLYNFSQKSGPQQVLRSTVSQEPSLTVVPKNIGTYSFELIVNDGRANSEPALCVVEVIKPNSAPVAKVTAPQKAIIRTRHRFNTAKTEPVKQSTAQRIIIPKASTTHKAQISKPKRLEAKVELAQTTTMPKAVQEIEDLSSTQPLNITPMASTSGDMTVIPGTKVVIKGFGVDPDGDSLKFVWNQVSGPMIPGSPISRKNLAFIPRKEGTYVFELIVDDGKNRSEPATCSVRVANSRGTSVQPASLQDSEVIEDINSLELSIPDEEDPIQASALDTDDEEDISFRELFSID